MTQKILMVVTSNNVMGATGKLTGIWAEELALPYYAFIDAGFAVDIASPKGGQAPIDPGSVKPEGQNVPSVNRMLYDEALKMSLTQTFKTETVDAKAYAAIFFPGGHGTMWDMATDAGTKGIVETADRNNIPIGAVCHGVSALVSARRSDGQPIVAGRRINSFTDAEEEAAGLTKVMPFLLESKLRELGARFEGAANWQAFAVTDGLLVTGQNPRSSELVAAGVLETIENTKRKVA
jgi:putative intracellular protease/amidase